MVEERQPVGYLALEIAYEVNFGGRTVRRREQSQLRVQVTHQTRNCTPGLFDRQPCSVLSEIRSDVRSVLDASRTRLYYLAALKAACNLAASSCVTDVFKILPPIPFSSFSTFSLSGDGLLTSTKRAEPPGISVPTNSFMN